MAGRGVPCQSQCCRPGRLRQSDTQYRFNSLVHKRIWRSSDNYKCCVCPVLLDSRNQIPQFRGDGKQHSRDDADARLATMRFEDQLAWPPFVHGVSDVIHGCLLALRRNCCRLELDRRQVFMPFGQIRDLLLQSPQCLLDQPTARGEWDRISFVGYGRKVSKTKRLVQSRPHPFLRRVNSLIRGLPVSPKKIIEDRHMHLGIEAFFLLFAGRLEIRFRNLHILSCS